MSKQVKQPTASETEQLLRQSIQQELMKCDPDITPYVCSRTRTLDGYKAVEQEIITMVINQGLMPSACVAQLESAYSHE